MVLVRTRRGPARSERRGTSTARRKKHFTPESMAAARFLLGNFLATRSLLPYGQRDEEIDQGDLDIDKECRYPKDPDVFHFRSLYVREGIAQRINDVYPDECFSIYPDLYQTEASRSTSFERKWDQMLDGMDPWGELHRFDRMMGLGRYGGLLLGFDDGRDLDRPISGFRKDGTRSPSASDYNLLYMMPYSEDLISINKFEQDKSSPRYMMPVSYQLKLADPRNVGDVNGNGFDTAAVNEVNVHWTRIQHGVDNRMSSRWAGIPRMKPVVNRIHDLRKILGSSAEMFFKGGFPGYTFNTYPDLAGNVEIDEDTIRDQLENYMNGLQRYLASEGGEFKALLSQVADPTNHIVQQMMYICASLRVPFRIMTGSEAGHLASTQDAGTWNRRLAMRQKVHLNPNVIRPFVNRLMQVGTLPRVKSYKIEWRDLNSMTDVEKSKVALAKAQAMMQYVSGKVESIMPLREFFTMVMGMTPAEADAVITSRMGMSPLKFLSKPAWDASAPKPQGGGRTGNAPKKASGRPR